MFGRQCGFEQGGLRIATRQIAGQNGDHVAETLGAELMAQSNMHRGPAAPNLVVVHPVVVNQKVDLQKLDGDHGTTRFRPTRAAVIDASLLDMAYAFLARGIGGCDERRAHSLTAPEREAFNGLGRCENLATDLRRSGYARLQPCCKRVVDVTLYRTE